MRVIVTGAAGFIGFHVSRALLSRGDQVIGVDNVNDYYDVELKRARVRELEDAAFVFCERDLADPSGIDDLFDGEALPVVHLAAQAGVRHSLVDPHSYIHSNITGTLNVLEACRRVGSPHLLYASSASVYGASERTPFTENGGTEHPVSLYGATKKADEVMVHSYAHLYGLPSTGLRFFSVYGPWGRPDMALFQFTKAILADEPIELYNSARMTRSFTYIDDIVRAVVALVDRPATPDESWDPLRPKTASSRAPFRIFNIGGAAGVPLLDLVRAIEDVLGRRAHVVMAEIQPGDVPTSIADTSALRDAIGFSPTTPMEEGVRRFVEWYLDYHHCDPRN